MQLVTIKYVWRDEHNRFRIIRGPFSWKQILIPFGDKLWIINILFDYK